MRLPVRLAMFGKAIKIKEFHEYYIDLSQPKFREFKMWYEDELLYIEGKGLTTCVPMPNVAQFTLEANIQTEEVSRETIKTKKATA